MYRTQLVLTEPSPADPLAPVERLFRQIETGPSPWCDDVQVGVPDHPALDGRAAARVGDDTALTQQALAWVAAEQQTEWAKVTEALLGRGQHRTNAAFADLLGSTREQWRAFADPVSAAEADMRKDERLAAFLLPLTIRSLAGMLLEEHRPESAFWDLQRHTSDPREFAADFVTGRAADQWLVAVAFHV